MNIIIKKNEILKVLKCVIGVIERKQTLPILGNILFKSIDGILYLTATDNEIEIVSHIALESIPDFETTIPGRKLLDICNALHDDADISITIEENQVILASGRSRFTLSTLPAKDYPTLEDIDAQQTYEIPQKNLKSLIDKTAFAMAQQDVRYYLNGVLMEISSQKIKLVATDGHRLALSEYNGDFGSLEDNQIIIPRKGILELSRLLDLSDVSVKITISQNHIRVETDTLSFTSKLIDGKFPDYNRVIPVDGDKIMSVNRDTLKASMVRISILSNEKYRGIRLTLTEGNLAIRANNPDQDEAEDEVSVNYKDTEIIIGFNVSYLIDVLNVLNSEEVQIKLKDGNSSCIVSDANDPLSLYVVMPMRL